MINSFREVKSHECRRRFGTALSTLGGICLGVLGLALALVVTPVYAQDPTPVPPIVITLYAPTQEPTATPTPLPTVDPASVGYAPTGSTGDWSVEGIVTWTTVDYDFGCPFSYNTEATGAVAVCIAYTQITGWQVIDLVIPVWPFEAALALVIIGWLVRR